MWLPGQKLKQFIRRHGLASTTPVDLGPIMDLYHVAYLPFTKTTLGCCIGKYIALNEALHPYHCRMVFAHEVTHQVLRHPNSLFLCQMGDWWYNRYEREAQQGAAIILVPLKPVVTLASAGATLREMQEELEVPAELVELRLRMARLIL